MTKYGVIIGSLRKGSFTEGVANAIVAGLPADAEVTFLPIRDLPLYDQDTDMDSPEIYKEFRALVAAQDAFIIATPEHNRNISAALKNALDIASRPWGENVWAGKPVLPASQSIAGIGGALANHSLKTTLGFLDMNIMQQPELYIGNTPELSNENGEITNEGTKEFLAGVAVMFDEFVQKNK